MIPTEPITDRTNTAHIIQILKIENKPVNNQILAKMPSPNKKPETTSGRDGILLIFLPKYNRVIASPIERLARI